MRTLLLPLVLPLVACSPERPKAPVDARSFYHWGNAARERADLGDGSWEALSAGMTEALPIERFVLKRASSPDFGLLELRFERGGAATRAGGMGDWPNPQGVSWSGELPHFEFARLCWLVETLDLPAESTRWQTGVTHQEEVVIAWTMPDGRSVELFDYGSAGPPQFAALAAALELAGRRIEWSPTEP